MYVGHVTNINIFVCPGYSTVMDNIFPWVGVASISQTCNIAQPYDPRTFISLIKDGKQIQRRSRNIFENAQAILKCGAYFAIVMQQVLIRIWYLPINKIWKQTMGPATTETYLYTGGESLQWKMSESSCLFWL